MKHKRIHPELRTKTRINQWFGSTFMAMVAAGIFISAARGFFIREEPWPLVFIRITIGVLFLWAAYYLWQSGRRNGRLTWLLEHAMYVPVRVSVDALKSGAVTVKMWPEGSDGQAGWEMLFGPPTWDYQLLEGTVVQALIDPCPGGQIALKTPHGILWPLEGSRWKRFRPARPDKGNGAARSASPLPPDHPLRQLSERLREDGLQDEAEWLESLAMGIAWTSSSEMIGELGLAAKKIQRSAHKRMSLGSRQALARFLKEVRKTWPGL